LTAKVAGLTQFRLKGMPGVPMPEIRLLKGAGIQGDFHQDISLLSAGTRRWMEAHAEKGLCFRRFRENILIEGLPLEELDHNSLLSVGNAVLRIRVYGKPCYNECGLYSTRTACRLSGRSVFAVAEQDEVIRIGDLVRVL